jgi:hypothetical protein
VHLHCCLGVACCVAEANGTRVKWTEHGGNIHANGEYGVLPATVARKLRFLCDAGSLHYFGNNILVSSGFDPFGNSARNLSKVVDSSDEYRIIR